MDRYDTLKYIWENSADIRRWYSEQHGFDIDRINRYNVRNYGVDQYGDLIDLILEDGIKDGIIKAEMNDDGGYEAA